MWSSIHNSCIFFAIFSITSEETKVLFMLQESLGSFTTEGFFLMFVNQKTEARHQVMYTGHSLADIYI